MRISKEAKLVVITALLSGLFTVTLLVLVNYFFNHSWNLFSNPANTQPFTVQGTSSITQKPDNAEISFTVTKTAPLLQDAQNEANKQTNTIVSDLKNIGIPQNDIKTNNYSSYPNTTRYNTLQMMPVQIPPPQSSQTPTGFTVSENIVVNLRDIGKAGSVIDTATKDGAENVSGPSLSFSESTQQSLIGKTRVLAIKDAKQKAQSMADAAGIKLGRILNIQENNTPYPIQPMMYGKAAVGTENSIPTQINPGENTITDTITLTYETW